MPVAATSAAMIGEKTAGQDDLGDQAVPEHAAAARRRDRRADHAADERVRRTRRDAEQPGDQVPDDPAEPGRRATTVSVTSLVSTRPLAIVAATASERNAPTRLSTPDKATATRGRSAPVAIEVAIALPVSWKPLVKSKRESRDDHQDKHSVVAHNCDGKGP